MTESLGSDAFLNWSLLWQTTLCLAAGGLTSYLWARRPARGHSLLLLALIAALGLPVLSELFRQMNWGLLVDNVQTVHVALAPSDTIFGNEDGGILLIRGDELVEMTEENFDGGSITGPPPHTADPTAADAAMRSDVSASLNGSSILALGWIALSCIILMRLAFSCRLGYRLLSTAEPIADVAIDRAVKSAADKLGLECVPEVRCSDLICCPVIWGWGRKPVLVIPRSLHADSSSVDWESIACHELAHWKRGDQLTSLFAWVFVGLLPWHPLAWWARRRLHELSERACDDWVLACGRSPTTYAETLLKLIPQKQSALALAAVSYRGNLQTRLARLLDGRKREPTAGLRWTMLFVIVTSLLVSGIALAQRRNRIRTQPVERGPISIRLVVRGMLESSQTVDIRSEVQGNNQIITLAREGKPVRKGDLLIELDTAKLQDRVSDETVKVHIAEAKLEQAEAQRASFTDDGEDKSKVKKKELDAIVSAAKVAVAVAAQSLSRVKKQLDKCKIYSPVDGMFVYYQVRGRRSEWRTEKGSFVRERQIIAQVVDPTRLHADVKVPASWASALKPGQAAVIRLDAFPDRVLDGEVKHVNQLADPGRWWSAGVREHAVLISFDTRAFAQKPGLSVEVELPIVELREALRVPVQAIERRDNRAYCLVRSTLGLERREIIVGLSNREFAEIKKGVTEGEEVVINPWRARGKAKLTRPLPDASDSVSEPAEQDGQGRARARQPSRQPTERGLKRSIDIGERKTNEGLQVELDFRSAPWSQVLGRLANQFELNLERELVRLPHDDQQAARLEAYLRLLYVIANRRDEAIASIDDLDGDEQKFWKHQLYGLLVSLDADDKHTSSRRAALALRDLQIAINHLANLSTLDLRNLAFCEKVDSYGRYTEFKSNTFRPGQEVLLYVEVENFAAESKGDKYETELQGEYEIFDADGRRETSVVLPLDKQLCNNRRRDYFVAYRLYVPQKIRPGAYTLQLTIEDVKGKKSNQASLEFRIR